MCALFLFWESQCGGELGQQKGAFCMKWNFIHKIWLDKKYRGLYLPQYNPYGIHLESVESIWNSIWNPWNQCWLTPQPTCCSMDIMDSMWNDHGMVNSIWNPSLFHMDSTGFHMECRHIHHGFHGQVHMDSMEQVHMELMTITFTVSFLF